MSEAAATTDEPTILDWAELSGREIAAIDRSRAVVVLSCSPLEVHGPHLPVVTDCLEAEQLVERAVRALMRRHGEIIALRLPTIYVATDVVPQVGSVRFRVSTVVDVLSDLGRSLAKQGFRRVWISNFHGGPRHFVAIEKACDTVNRRYGAEMISLFSLLIARLTGGATDISDVLGDLPGISRETLRGDSHGGAVETSMMLHLLAGRGGGRVDGIYRDLARRTIDAWASGKDPEDVSPEPLEGRGVVALYHHFKTRLKYFERETYAGAPAAASPEAGEAIVERLVALATEALDDVYGGRVAPSECHSPLWSRRWIFLSETLLRIFELAVGYKTDVF